MFNSDGVDGKSGYGTKKNCGENVFKRRSTLVVPNTRTLPKGIKEMYSRMIRAHRRGSTYSVHIVHLASSQPQSCNVEPRGQQDHCSTKFVQIIAHCRPDAVPGCLV